MERFTLVLLWSTTFDAAIAISALFWIVYRRTASALALHWEVRLGDVARAVAVAVLVSAVKLCGLMAAGAGVFGAMHLVYLDLAIVVPLIGAAVLYLWWVGLPGPGRVPPTWPAMMVGFAALLPAPIAVYATFVEPHALRVEHVAVPCGKIDSGAEMTIAVLADFQFSHVTDYERGAVARAMQLRPDLILMPGDIFQGNAEAFQNELPRIRGLLQPLHAPAGVYIVQGNCDTPERLWRATAGTCVTFLHNQIEQTEWRGLPVAVGGLELHVDSREAQETIDQLGNLPQGVLTILLAHYPDVALTFRRESGVDLIVSGHTHGGQVQIPRLGPLLTLSHVPRSVAAGGLSHLNGHLLYVSRGIGLERGHAPRVRLLCPPEVSDLRLMSPAVSAASGNGTD